MSETCVSPTFTDKTSTYQIFPPEMPPCIPDAVTEVKELLDESLVDLLTESSLQLLPEGG